MPSKQIKIDRKIEPAYHIYLPYLSTVFIYRIYLPYVEVEAEVEVAVEAGADRRCRLDGINANLADNQDKYRDGF